METIGQTPPQAVTQTTTTDADTYRRTAGRLRLLTALLTGTRLRIDGVECIVVAIEPDGIATRPVTDAD